MQRPTNLFISYLIFISFYLSPFIITAQDTQVMHVLIPDSEMFTATSSQANSETCSVSVDVPFTGTNNAYESENCGNILFTFSREGDDLSNPFLIEYTIGGTATNGVDYSGFPPSPIIIPPFISEFVIPVSTIADDIAEGMETLILSTAGECDCENGELIVNIFDTTELTVDVPDVEYCPNLGAPAILIANASGTAIIGTYSYDWGEGASPASILIDSPLETTSYTVTVTDMCGGYATGTGTIIVSNIEAVLEENISLCGDINDAYLDVNFFGSDGPFDLIYSIDAIIQPTLTSIVENPYQLNVTQTGIYTLEFVTTDNGCIENVIGTVNVIDDGAIELTSSFTNPNCAGINSGSIDLTIADADEEVVSYLWSNGSTLEDQENLSVGNYSVTITSGWCETTAEFVLNESTAISISAEVQQIDCINSQLGEIDISATGGNGTLTYNWNNGASVEDLTGLEAGTYIVTITDTDNCSSTQTIVIDTNTDWLFDVTNIYVSDVTCKGDADGIIALSVEEPNDLTFTWTENAGGQTGSAASGLGPGSYTVTVSNSINCVNTLSSNITEPDSFLIFNVDFTLPSCFDAGATINLSTIGGSPYAGDCGYLYQTVPQLPIDDCGTFTEVPAGEYEVIVVDDDSCIRTETIIIEESEQIVPTIELTSNSCEPSNESTINVTTIGGTPFSECGYIYSITPELPSTECGVFVNALAGTYTLTTEDSVGCQVFSTVEIDELELLSVNILTEDASCHSSATGIAIVQVTGGTHPYSGDGLIWNLTAGNYSLTVTDANGCELTADYVINEPEILTLDSEVQNASTGNSNDGSIFISNTQGGTPPYSFLWSNGATTPNLENVPAGDYSLDFIDSQSCVINYTFTIDATVATENSLTEKVEYSLHPNLVQKGKESILFVKSIENENLDVQVVSTSGKLLFEKQTRLEQGDNEIKIETTSLPAGLYFLNLKLDNTDYAVIKFVVF